MVERWRKWNLYLKELAMGIAYKELFRVNCLVYGPGPGGFFIKRFKENGYSEAELIDLITGMDFSPVGRGASISLCEKCGIVKWAVEKTCYTDWAPTVICLVLTVTTGFSVFGWAEQAAIPSLGNLIASLFPVTVLVGLLVYSVARFQFELKKSRLLCALDHIEAIEKAGQDCKTK